MQPDREEKREHEIEKSGPTAKINDGHIIGDGAHQVNREPAVPHLDCLQSRWTCHLEKWKEHQPDRLPVPFVAHQPCFPMVCQVSIPFVIALVRMMFQMIN